MYARADVSVCLQNIHLICKNMWVKKRKGLCIQTRREKTNTVDVSNWSM